MTEQAVPTTIDLRKYIDFKHFGERPHIRGRRLLVSMVAVNAQGDHWSVPELAEDFSITEEQVLAALLYYHEHKTEIDAQDAEEIRQFDAMAEQHNSSSES
jgi:uncharacterized protein (DUF433 family)